MLADEDPILTVGELEGASFSRRKNVLARTDLYERLVGTSIDGNEAKAGEALGIDLNRECFRHPGQRIPQAHESARDENQLVPR